VLAGVREDLDYGRQRRLGRDIVLISEQADAYQRTVTRINVR
jgi:hypothetical protein